MTFPRKGTRRLTVAGRAFLWHVSPKSLDYGGNQCTVQAASGRGRLLCFWPAANHGFPSPREASEAIAFALAHGWDADAPGCPLWVERRATGLALTEHRPPPLWGAHGTAAATR
jgi:hypothetical protein